MKEMILTSSVLILAIALLRRLLKGKLDPRVQYALWLLAAARLLIPGTLFSAPVSVAGAAAELERAIQVQTPAPTAPQGVFLPEETCSVQSVPGSVPAAPSRPEKTERNWPDLVWKAGMCVMAGAMLLSNFHFFLTLRTRRRKLEVQCGSLPVYAVKGLASPCLFGLLRPAVYLTARASETEHLDYVLAHEYTHFRHGDHLWSLLRGVCLIVHWYNPLVWWAAALCRRDCELACDAGAIARLGEDRRLDYGQTLLRLVSAGRGSLLCTATTMTAGKRTMAERVALIAKRPRMMKITLAAAVLVMCAAAAVTFGGAAEKAEDPPEPAQTDGAGESEPPPAGKPQAEAPAITEAEALALYAKAREAWDWFDIGLMTLTDETYDAFGNIYNRVSGFDSQEELKNYLETLFTPEITDYLLRIAGPFRDHDGGLYMLAAGRGSDLNAGEESVSAFVHTPEEAEEYGYAAHIFARTEVLDEDLETVLGRKSHDFYIVWNGSEYVFSNFGPWDDVDLQLYYNAQEISTLLASGADTEEWLPLMSYMDWGALADTGDSELCEAVYSAIYDFVQERRESLDIGYYYYILSATESLDGALSEGFQGLVSDLYNFDRAKFAHVVLDSAPRCQDAIINYLRWEWARRREDAPTREEAVARLEADLAESIYAGPTEATLTSLRETFQFQLFNAYGVYAAVYTSADTDVAWVDQNGAVTARGPGETTITLHYEGEAGNRDFTCRVRCQWGHNQGDPGTPETPETSEPPAWMDEMRAASRTWGDLGLRTPENIELELDDWSYEGLRQAIWNGLEDYFRGSEAAELMAGRLAEIELGSGFSFPAGARAGDVLTVPYVATYSGDAKILSNGESFTPTSSSWEVTATVRLAGQGGDDTEQFPEKHIGPVLGLALDGAAPDETLYYDGTEDGMWDVVLQRLEDYALSQLGQDVFDHIEVEGRPALSEDGRLTVEYSVTGEINYMGTLYRSRRSGLTTTYTMVPYGE